MADTTSSTEKKEVVASATLEPKQSPADYSDFGGVNTKEDSHEMWLALKEQYFANRPILESKLNTRLKLKAPARAENDALVPVIIDLNENEVDDDRFQKVYLIVDVNPRPIGGIFTLANNRKMEQLKTSVRVNGYTYIRAVGETVSGKLFMAKQWVKSTGAGCSAPPNLDQAAHKKRQGKMRFKEVIRKKKSNNSRLMRLIISHPNNTGMQRDQVSTMFIPEHYVKHIKVTFNKELVLEAETTFTLSENPNFIFSFNPFESGELRADMTDNLENFYSIITQINGRLE